MAAKLRKSYTHLKEKIEELATEKELLSITLSGMSEGVIAIDINKHIILYNTVAENLTGWEFADVEGKVIDEVFRVIDKRTKDIIESGTVKIERELVDIAVVVEKVLSALEPLAEKNNIRLKANSRNELPKLQVDESKIESVITNLLNNAIKFTPEHGHVVICVEAANGEMVIRVSDTGMGIPREALSKIFDRFYRVHRPGKQIQGTGLGLAIVNKIVTMHGGRIDVESEVDHGTTFTVFLPLATESIPELSPARADNG